MGETQVTQAQWRAVALATNGGFKPRDRLKPEPSHFKGPPDLPVEQVTWDDCRKYCDRFNALLREGPGFGLPTEARWEYASRAGTTTALHNGPLTIRGANDGPELDPIAWYGGNSGLDLEVTNPIVSWNWPKKQHEHQTAGTHRVKLKQPNAWGLYDTLGNVWEWCSDAMRNYSAEPQTDPFDPGIVGTGRVVRGGSWNDQAGGCRGAIRDFARPGLDWFNQGFRLAAGQEIQTAEPRNAEHPVGRRRGAGAGGRGPQAQSPRSGRG
jgi:formylglycine-generating enzyme required for sulfatase activity